MIKGTRQLLAEYAADGSEAAFRDMVARYLNLVHSTALRLAGGNAQLAEDVSQAVFLSLARKGRTLSSKVTLGGWLHQHTYYVAHRAMRSEQRPQIREREAVEMNTLQDDSGAHWRLLAHRGRIIHTKFC
jgi:DNA-directed RNA polymerase specialized sigma24 family protein